MLTLTKPHPETDNIRMIDIDVIDVLLPCRSFRIYYKVAELGKVSLTTEFLLRLLYAADGIDEKDMESFFGFNRRESSFVLREVEHHGYVERRGGRLWLTITGRGLFRDGDDEPKIYDVQKRTERVGFDLLALAPERRVHLEAFERMLPELPVRDLKLVSSATSWVREFSFRQYYAHFATQRDADALAKRSLYSIDDVIAEERFSTVVRFIMRSSVVRPGFPEPDLNDWHSGHDLDDRSEVVEAVSGFVENLTRSSKPEDALAYQLLVDFAPEFLKEFLRRDGLSVDRFFRETVERAGEARKDRPTIPIVGSLFTPGNNKRLFEVLAYGLDGQGRSPVPHCCLWMLPQCNWGMTNVLPATLSHLAQRVTTISAQEDDTFRSVAMVPGKPPRHIKEAFDECVERVNWIKTPTNIEILVVPGALMAALVHAPIQSASSVPVPLGIMSFDQKVVERASKFLSDRLCQPLGGFPVEHSEK